MARTANSFNYLVDERGGGRAERKEREKEKEEGDANCRIRTSIKLRMKLTIISVLCHDKERRLLRLKLLFRVVNGGTADKPHEEKERKRAS